MRAASKTAGLALLTRLLHTRGSPSIRGCCASLAPRALGKSPRRSAQRDPNDWAHGPPRELRAMKVNRESETGVRASVHANTGASAWVCDMLLRCLGASMSAPTPEQADAHRLLGLVLVGANRALEKLI